MFFTKRALYRRGHPDRVHPVRVTPACIRVTPAGVWVPAAVFSFALALYFLLSYLLAKPWPVLAPGGYYRVNLAEENCSFELPASTVIIEEGRFLSEEVCFHLAFHDPVMKLHGFLEKWRVEDLAGFLTAARENAGLALHGYKQQQTNGRVELFYFQTGREGSYLGREFFFPLNDGSYLRWAFFLPAGLYQPWHEEVFARIVGSFRFTQGFLEVPGEEGPPAGLAQEFPKHAADLPVPVPAGMFQPLAHRRLGDAEDLRHFDLGQALPGQFNGFPVGGAPIVAQIALYDKEGIS